MYKGWKKCKNVAVSKIDRISYIILSVNFLECSVGYKETFKNTGAVGKFEKIHFH